MAGLVTDNLQNILVEKMNLIVEKNGFLEAEMKKKKKAEIQLFRRIEETEVELSSVRMDLVVHMEQSSSEIESLKAAVADLKSLHDKTQLKEKESVIQQTQKQGGTQQLVQCKQEYGEPQQQQQQQQQQQKQLHQQQGQIQEQQRQIQRLQKQILLQQENLQQQEKKIRQQQQKIQQQEQEIRLLKDKQQQILQRQQQQQQEQVNLSSTPSPASAISSSLPPAKDPVPVARLTPGELRDLKKKARFDVKFSACSPNLPKLEHGKITKVQGYDWQTCMSPFMNKRSGVYTTPVSGKYRFCSEMKVEEERSVRLFLCEDGEGRREMMEFKGKKQNECGRNRTFVCGEGVNVWVEGELVKGNEAEAWFCQFSGELVQCS